MVENRRLLAASLNDDYVEAIGKIFTVNWKFGNIFIKSVFVYIDKYLADSWT